MIILSHSTNVIRISCYTHEANPVRNISWITKYQSDDIWIENDHSNIEYILSHVRHFLFNIMHC